MTLYKHVNGQRVEMTAEEEREVQAEWAAPDYDKDTQRRVKSTDANGNITYTVEPKTQTEIDEYVTKQVDAASGISLTDKALGMTLADIWYVLNTGNVPGGADRNMTIQEARQAVRSRLESHIRNIKGL